MDLSHLPRIPIGFWPTPLETLPRLTQHLGGPQIWIKRDDQSGLATGGNKARKLEFLLGEARAQNADTLITTGAPQSNHARQTAATAARAGMKCVLVLRGVAPAHTTGNILLDRLLGADIIWAASRAPNEVMQELADELSARGQRPYIIPGGGSNATGAFGYIVGLQEMLDQAKAAEVVFDAIVFATSSGGTQAGLVAAARELKYNGRIAGISVGESAAVLKPILVTITNEAAQRAGISGTFDLNDFEVNEDYIGGGYSIMGPAEREAIELAARYEGLLVDPVYTGRAFAGLIDLVRKGVFASDQNILFWHTGGLPALFAYADQLT